MAKNMKHAIHTLWKQTRPYRNFNVPVCSSFLHKFNSYRALIPSSRISGNALSKEKSRNDIHVETIKTKAVFTNGFLSRYVSGLWSSPNTKWPFGPIGDHNQLVGSFGTNTKDTMRFQAAFHNDLVWSLCCLLHNVGRYFRMRIHDKNILNSEFRLSVTWHIAKLIVLATLPVYSFDPGLYHIPI